MNAGVAMTFETGQLGVWSYRPQQHRQRVYLVDVEIVQTGRLRLRVRARTAACVAVVRWVQAKNLRAKAPDEPAYPFRQLDR
jgi:hypothetical protein